MSSGSTEATPVAPVDAAVGADPMVGRHEGPIAVEGAVSCVRYEISAFERDDANMEMVLVGEWYC